MEEIGRIFLALLFCVISCACSKQDKPQSGNNPIPDKVITMDWAENQYINDTNPINQEINDALKRGEYMEYGGKKHLVLAPYILMNLETSEVIDLRNRDRTKRSNYN